MKLVSFSKAFYLKSRPWTISTRVAFDIPLQAGLKRRGNLQGESPGVQPKMVARF